MLHWITLWCSTYCSTNGTRLCGMSLLFYHRMKRRVYVPLHSCLCYFLTISRQSWICSKRWLVGREKTPCIVPLHLFQCLDTHDLLQVLIGRLRQELPSDNSFLCFLPLHVLGPFCPPEDVVQGISFMVKEEGRIHFDCQCHAPLSPSGPTIAHPSTLGSPGILPRAVVLPLYFQKKWELNCPGSAMSGDESDAADGCARSWKPTSVYVLGSVLPGHVPLHHL